MEKQSFLFTEYPVLEDDLIVLHRMTDEDAEALAKMCAEEEVYRYVPAFLFDLKYEDKHEMIAKMDEECFDTRESLFLGVYLRENGKFTGLAEFYAYEPERRKCSIGIRFMKEYWGQGLATRTEKLMVRYLVEKANMRVITTHVAQDNLASAAVQLKSGFEKRYVGLPEDWGFDKPVIIDKYVIKSKG